MRAGAARARVIFLKPGELVVSAEPARITTLLGSCVAVTMYSARLRLGAVCHALLPACRRERPCCNGEAGRYVECAVKLMLKELNACGVVTCEIEAKIFGGSDMFDTLEGHRNSVGMLNIEMAVRVLDQTGVRVQTRDLGGPRGRKIIFHTDTGEVFLKRLKKTEV